MGSRLKKRSEWDIIDLFANGQPKAPLRYGIGDDAAVFGNIAKQSWLITQDVLIEGTHFRLDWISPEDLAYKAIAVNLSDLAAMAATPRLLLLTLGLPRLPRGFMARGFIDRFARAFGRYCRQYRLQLIGGDTCVSKRGLWIEVTALGTAVPAHIVYRRGARVGDLIYITGPLGASALGLHCLEHGIPSKIVRRHLRPPIRTDLAQAIGKHGFASAMTDISDGLLIDLEELCGQTLAQLDMNQLPIDRPTRTLAARLGLDPLPFALGGGEDYELVFTVPKHKESRFLRWCSKHRHAVFRIGTMTRCKGKWSFSRFKKGYEARFE